MSNNTGKGRQILIPCASSVCSSGSDGQNPLSDDYDEDLEVCNLYLKGLFRVSEKDQKNSQNEHGESFASFWHSRSTIDLDSSLLSSVIVSIQTIQYARSFLSIFFWAFKYTKTI
jgi:hypothetical protein